MAALEYYLSGGAANSNPALSLGGVVSSTRLYSQSVAWDGSGITGITLIDAAGNPANNGALAYTSADNSVTWKPYGAISAGPAVDLTGVSTDAVTIPGSDDPYNPKGSLVVSVVEGSLPGADTSDLVGVSNILDNLFEEILTAEAEAGSTIYRGIYIKNIESSAFFLSVALAAVSIAGDGIAIGLEPTVGTMQTITNETTAPTGISFSDRNRPLLDEVNTIDENEYWGLWIRRTVQPYTTIGASPSTLQIKAFTY